jgi:hypothetical protein
MSEEKKYITFKDLRTVSNKPEANTTSPSTTSTSSPPSTSSITSKPSTASNTSTPSTPPLLGANESPPPAEPRPTVRSAPGVAPERDFQRIPNSITRRALPEGLFRGKSKQVWDYLWSVSRGAVVPTRTVRKSRREIKAGSGLGSMVTVDAALEHLQNVGLIAIRPSIGSLVGNEYEVFTPEEASTRLPSISSTTSPIQNLVNLDVPDSSSTSRTQLAGNTGGYSPPKTSFKTNTENDDDEAFAKFAQVLQEAAKQVTGKRLNPSDKERLGELAELLVTELKIAAARTTNVSSVPAFLTEHLRRRLWKVDKKLVSEEGKPETSSAESILSNEEARNCPDCGGSGMYYPQGYEKGVAKCRHERLKSSAGPKPEAESQETPAEAQTT